jgi:hypothetical protein
MKEIRIFVKRKNNQGVKRTNNFQGVEWGINITDGKQEVE